MKKLVTATLIPALAAIAVIGSGFSVFYFGNQTSTTGTLNPSVEGIVTTGGLTAPKTMDLYFDQTADTRKVFSTSFNSDTDGIYLVNTDTINTELSIKYSKPKGDNETDDVTGASRKLIHTYVLVPEVYDKYLTITEGSGAKAEPYDGVLSEDLTSAVGKGTTYMLAWSLDAETGDTITRTLPGKGVTSDLFNFAYAAQTTEKNPFSRTADFKYKDSVTTNEPTSTDEYKTMKDDIANAVAAKSFIKIVTTVTLVNA